MSFEAERLLERVVRDERQQLFPVLPASRPAGGHTKARTRLRWGRTRVVRSRSRGTLALGACSRRGGLRRRVLRARPRRTTPAGRVSELGALRGVAHRHDGLGHRGGLPGPLRDRAVLDDVEGRWNRFGWLGERGEQCAGLALRPCAVALALCLCGAVGLPLVGVHLRLSFLLCGQREERVCDALCPVGRPPPVDEHRRVHVLVDIFVVTVVEAEEGLAGAGVDGLRHRPRRGSPRDFLDLPFV